MTTALLIPCYRAEQYLTNLRNIVTRLEPQFDEVLLADDGSDDGTVAEAKKLGFTILELGRNFGPGGARNRLAQKSRCDWIHFLDADDELAWDYLGHVLPFTSESADVILSGADFVAEQDRALIKRWSFCQEDFDQDQVNSAFRSPIPLHCSLIRRESFLAIGGFDENRRCWEDGDMHLRLAVAGARFKVIENVLSISPRHRRGASASSRYCQCCRLDFIRDYIRKEYPLSQQLLARETCDLSVQLAQNQRFRRAFEACRLSSANGAEKATSKNWCFNSILQLLPTTASLFLSNSVRGYAKRLKE